MCGFLFSLGSDLKEKEFKGYLEKIAHRGPDNLTIRVEEKASMGFVRLAIMDLSSTGEQPFVYKSKRYLCNGEIYNFRKLKEFSTFNYQTDSDCEVLIPLFEEHSISEVLTKIDGEFAFVVYDEKTADVVAARDPMGIRPLFYGTQLSNGKVAFASEVKALTSFCEDIKPLPPGSYYEKGEIVSYIDLADAPKYVDDNLETVTQNIRELLVEGVCKRLDSDAPLGFLLSGGLDSSLVCAIAQRHSDKPIKTYAIGMSEDAIDLKYAKEVADFIGSDHTEVVIRKDDVIGSIETVVHQLETYDITTVRASIGMYLVCKYIKENTDVKALMTGEVSDEIFGYKYTDFAPSPEEFQNEAAKRVRELYAYDVLRADRCIAGNSLEARVPFSETSFVQYVMSIDPKLKMNTYGQGKYLLRKAFEGEEYLPDSILYREKAAFSDAVGHSMVDYIKEYADEKYAQEDVDGAKAKYKHATPFTKESLMYRDLFEKDYAGMSYLVPGFWMPNNEWENCDVKDPSARVLPNYGDSGS